MLSWLSPSRGPSLSLQLIRHFSIRISSLKKQSLVAQLLRGNGSPKLSKSAQKGQLCLAPRQTSQQGQASLRSVYPHSPLGLPAELPGLENGTQKEKHLDAAKLSVRSKKEVRRGDVAANFSVLLPREGSLADRFEGETELPVLSKPSRIQGSKAHHSIGDTQPRVRALDGSKKGQARDGDGKPFQTDRRKVDTAEVSVQPQISGEEGHHSHIPVETKPGEKSLALQVWGASQNPGHSVDKLRISHLNTEFSKEISSLVSEVEDERGKCDTEKLSSSKNDKEEDVQNAVKHNLLQLKSAVAREISERLEVERLVELYAEMIREEVTDKFLNDWQRMSVEMVKFFNDLQQKIELLSVEAVQLVHVKALLMNREFLSATPEKLADVLTILKMFCESGDKACEILTSNTKIIKQPLEKLQQRLKVLVEFEVDKATICMVATSIMRMHAKKIRRFLSFLKDIGLGAESRNRMFYKAPRMVDYSVRNRMQPNVNFFESIQATRSMLLKVLELHPGIILTSPTKKLRVMHKLFQHVGLSSTEFIDALWRLRYVHRDPFLCYDFFKEQGLSDETFASMIKRSPNILTVPVEVLEAKLHFLLHEAKRDISEIVGFPSYFNYSLAKRIMPRLKLLAELNLPRQLCLSTCITSKKLDFLAV